MPASLLSFGVTDAYRARVGQIRRAAQAVTRINWRLVSSVDDAHGIDLDAGHELWAAQVTPSLVAAQRVAVQASAGYLTAFLTSELGAPTEAAQPTGQYVGTARDGRPVPDLLRSPLIGAKGALGEGRPLARALEMGLNRAVRLVGMEVDAAARAALADAIVADDRVRGYRRAVSGTCGACLGAASGTFDGDVHFEVHPGCECVSEPWVDGARDAFPRLTGDELFAEKTSEEQDEAVGPVIAELVRTGAVSLAGLVERQKQRSTDERWISQRPIDGLPAKARRRAAELQQS